MIPKYFTPHPPINWTELVGAPKANWSGVASSGDGVFLVAIQGSDGRGNPNGAVFTSSDQGITWIERRNATRGNVSSVFSLLFILPPQ